MPDSRPLPPRSNVAEWTCPSCGAKYLAKSAACPSCSTLGGKRGEDDLTKKIVDDNDLMKGFRSPPQHVKHTVYWKGF
jgi:hypothetical protein